MSWYFPWVSHVLTFLGWNCIVNAVSTIYNVMGEQIEESRTNYVTGHPRNVMHAYFDQVSQTKNPESSFFKGHQQRFTAGDIFMGAATTAAASMDYLLYYMAREPNVQQKLQAEIDNISGSTFKTNIEPQQHSLSNMMKMPYTEAVIKELLRITSVVPLAMFHRSLKEVIFQGYRIPKDTWIVANLYGIHHDPDIWIEPHLFQPERFLNAEAKDSSTLTSTGLTLPFSSGKRNCIGEAFAKDQLFLFITNFFQKFRVSCSEDLILPKTSFGFVMAPPPFELTITERNVTPNYK